MELRRCSHLHFFNTIRAGLVEKICNVNSRGRPIIAFKKLEDIYKTEDAKKLRSLSTLHSQDRCADMVFDCGRVKTESPHLPLVDRRTKKRDISMDKFNCNSDDNEDGGDSDDLNFGKMTLKQLKDQCKAKKRKVRHSVCGFLEQDYTARKPEDVCDLEEPISSWRSKLSRKGKRKPAKKCSASSPQTEVSEKSEQSLSDKETLQCSSYLPAPFSVKVEISETEYSECRNMTSVADDSSNSCNELLGLDGGVSGGILQAVEPELEPGTQISLTEEWQICVVNEVPSDYLDCTDSTEPTCLLPSIFGEAMEEDNLKEACQKFLVLPASEDNGEGCIEHPLLEESSPETTFHEDMCNSYQSNSFVHVILRQTGEISGVQVPDMVMDDNLSCMELRTAGDPCNFEDEINENLPQNLEILRSPMSKFISSRNSHPCLSPENVLVAEYDPLETERPPVMPVITDAARNCSSPNKNPVAFEGGSTTIEEKNPPRSTSDDTERNSPKRNHHCDAVYEPAVSGIQNYHHLGQCHPPERLLSTRKAISPTSQEKLCKAMKGVELIEEIDHHKCKKKLKFRKETDNKASTAEPDTEGAEVYANPEGLVEVTSTEVTVIPKQISKEPKNTRKGSPPKGIRRDPNLSHSLPQVGSGATSIQSCSEMAIAFSQRQMHDIDYLAMKLMKELKSMKDIVEAKVHSEVSPTIGLKFDVDEVKTAIGSATKVEETTRKWLSMMGRDCNRFCKLMRTTDKGGITSGKAIHKERKKITFADEAGGVLCHVKYFED